MEIYKFIKWMWSRVHRHDKQGVIVILFTIVTGILLQIYGVSVAATIALSVLALIGSVIAVVLYNHILNLWDRYQSIKEKEANSIINKLRGNDGSVTMAGHTMR